MQSLVAWQERMAQTDARLDLFEADLKQDLLEIKPLSVEVDAVTRSAMGKVDVADTGGEPVMDQEAWPSFSAPHPEGSADPANHTASGREHLELFMQYKQEEQQRLEEKERRRKQEADQLRHLRAEEEVKREG